MQGYYHTTVEMYRDTTDHRNIKKQVGAMQEKYGRCDQLFMTYKTKQKTEKGVG
jgi:predicted  nucleic acid-binding Zn ribbon protein